MPSTVARYGNLKPLILSPTPPAEPPQFVREPERHITAEMEKVVDIPCRAKGNTEACLRACSAENFDPSHPCRGFSKPRLPLQTTSLSSDRLAKSWHPGNKQPNYRNLRLQINPRNSRVTNEPKLP